MQSRILALLARGLAQSLGLSSQLQSLRIAIANVDHDTFCACSLHSPLVLTVALGLLSWIRPPCHRLRALLLHTPSGMPQAQCSSCKHSQQCTVFLLMRSKLSLWMSNLLQEQDICTWELICPLQANTRNQTVPNQPGHPM